MPGPVSQVPIAVRDGKRGKAPLIRKLKMRYPELGESAIARRVGCSAANVHHVLKRFLGDNHSEAELRRYQQEKADIFDAIQMRNLESITNKDIKKSSMLQRVTGAAILEDKARIIRGQATSIDVHVLLDAVSAVREIRRSGQERGKNVNQLMTSSDSK
jgi:AraC-like DNA-binding protein